MIKKISIKNYKSIVDDEIELGRVNVFIGANGAGKSNILEAVAMFSAAQTKDLSFEGLNNRGIRITKPNLMTNSFLDEFKKDKIQINLTIKNPVGKELTLPLILKPKEINNINSEWINESITTEHELLTSDDELIASAREMFTDEIEKYSDIIEASQKIDTESQGKIIDVINKLVINNLAKDYPEKVIVTNSINNYQIYTLSTPALRGITQKSYKQPLGLNGENLDILLSTFDEEEWQLLRDYSHFISWLDDVFVDERDRLKFEGHKLGRSTSTLYFVDQFMRKNNNIFAAENANEGALYVLFYLALFISKKTPSFFAIDNIETALNPKICRALMKAISELAKITGKQVLITTHNPAVLDGINLTEQRLFVVSRTDEGHTKTKRLQFKPGGNQQKRKLSEYWMRGDLGGIPNNFI